MLDFINNQLSNLLSDLIHWTITAPIEQVQAVLIVTGGGLVLYLLIKLRAHQKRRHVHYVAPVVYYPVRKIEVTFVSEPQTSPELQIA